MTNAELVTASVVEKMVRDTLQDATGVRWTGDELVSWINAGVREIADLVPSSANMLLSVKMAAGTSQDVSSFLVAGSLIPLVGKKVVDVVRNMGADGSTPGAAINIINRTSLDAMIPDWHRDSASLTSIYYTFDPKLPRNFFVYPPRPTANPGYVSVLVTVAATPLVAVEGVLDGASVIPLSSEFLNPLADYILFRCFSKNSASPNAAQRVQFHASAFSAALSAMAEPGRPAQPQQPAPQQAPQ